MEGVFVEDVRGIPRRAVSLSSCDSDPLAYRHNGGGLRSSQSSMYGGSESDGDDEAAETRSCGGDSVVSAASSCRSGGGGGGGGRDRRYHALEAVDIQEQVGHLGPARVAAAGGACVAPALNNSSVPADAAVGGSTDLSGEVSASIALDYVSEAPVASVEAVIVSSSTVVAAKQKDALVLDAGTRICLADGTIVGVVATVLGPISFCSYAIACRPAVVAELAMVDRLAEGTLLHYDVTKQVVLYDPSTQCDYGKGTDASFVQDEELPVTARPDFSDDEDERAWKRRRRECALAGDGKAGAAPVAKVVAATESAADAEVLSSSESEVEFDDEGNMVSYRPRRRRRGL